MLEWTNVGMLRWVEGVPGGRGSSMVNSRRAVSAGKSDRIPQPKAGVRVCFCVLSSWWSFCKAKKCFCLIACMEVIRSLQSIKRCAHGARTLDCRPTSAIYKRPSATSTSHQIWPSRLKLDSAWIEILLSISSRGHMVPGPHLSCDRNTSYSA